MGSVIMGTWGLSAFQAFHFSPLTNHEIPFRKTWIPVVERFLAFTSNLTLKSELLHEQSHPSIYERGEDESKSSANSEQFGSVFQ